MTSLWLDGAHPLPDDPLPLEEQLDDVVVGGGLTGLTTAVLLARVGRRVAVVEARHVGAVATGNTSAKLSLLQGTHLSRILSHQSERVARAYVEANREGMEWLLRFCEDQDVEVQRRPAITYAAAQSELGAVEQEHEAASELGLDVDWRDTWEVPFPLYGATVLAEQAQFDPMHVVMALAAQLRVHGGTIHQGHRVTAVSRRGAPKVRLADGTTLRADQVVLATGTPILDRGLYFAKLEPQRSYGLAFASADAPNGMFLSAGADSRSVRDAPSVEGGALLLVGGSGHTVGRTRSELEHVVALREWTAEYFPWATETHQWSAQDYRSHDGIPYVGDLPRGGGRIHVATGFGKWGMTNAVVAARTISGKVLGKEPSWAKTMGRRITRPSAAAEMLRTNVGVGLALAGGVVRAGVHAAPRDPPEGTGGLGRDGLVPTGRATQDGQICTVVGLCTHLGGVLKWNDSEHSWDCPLHGSRFAPDGEVLEGPATRPLVRRPSGATPSDKQATHH